MALQSNDFFVINRGDVDYKYQYSEILDDLNSDLVGDGRITINDSDGNQVGQFTVNQSGDTIITLPESAEIPNSTNFKGFIDVSQPAPVNPQAGDLYIQDSGGNSPATADASFAPGITGNVDDGVIVLFDSDGNWEAGGQLVTATPNLQLVTDEGSDTTNSITLSAGGSVKIRLDAGAGNGDFTGKVTSASTEASDSDTTLVTKDYLETSGGDGGGGFVEKAGDNMTGDLTLGTDKIKLKKDGKAEFSSSLDCGPLRALSTTITRSTGGSSAELFKVNDGIDNVITFRRDGSADFGKGHSKITSSGSATFNGNLTVGVSQGGDTATVNIGTNYLITLTDGTYDWSQVAGVGFGTASEVGESFTAIADASLPAGNRVATQASGGSASFSGGKINFRGNGQSTFRNNTVFTSENSLIYPDNINTDAFTNNSIVRLSNTDTTSLGTASIIEFAGRGGTTNVARTFISCVTENDTDGNYLSIASHRQTKSTGERLRIGSGGTVSIGGDLAGGNPNIKLDSINGTGTFVGDLNVGIPQGADTDQVTLNVRYIITATTGTYDWSQVNTSLSTSSPVGTIFKANSDGTLASGNTVATAASGGNGTFTGTITTQGGAGGPYVSIGETIKFNTDADNDANYTLTTEEYEEQEELTPYIPEVPATYDEDGNELTAVVPAVEATYQTVTKTREIRTYTGPTLDVKERLQNLLARIDAMEANEVIDDATDSSLLTLVSNLDTRLTGIETRLAALESE